MKKQIITFTILFISIILFGCVTKGDINISAVTGATPVAIMKKASARISLKITGLVKHEHVFNAETLNMLASTRIRTQELSCEGTLIGTYAYIGIPVLYILEGVSVNASDGKGAFDRPLDFIVTFKSSSGKISNFSYGEIIFVNDALPLTLAFDRQEIRASKEPDRYNKNINKENIEGLRLISPRDADTSRYLDDVVEIILRMPEVAYNKLPQMKKGKCSSKSVICVNINSESEAKFDEADRKEYYNWFRTGHGMGFKGISEARGYSLKSFLKKNFPACKLDNYFLFVACDGYRCIFSGREIFEHGDGESMMIVDKINGNDATGAYMLAPVKDYYVDRDVWGLSHIVMLDNI